MQLDYAIAEAIRQQKPVYISICCNLPGLPHPTFDGVPVPFAIAPKLSNPRSKPDPLQQHIWFGGLEPPSVGMTCKHLACCQPC